MARRMWIALGAAAVLVAPVACGTDDGGEVSTGVEEAVEEGGGAGGAVAGPTAAFMGQVAENTAEAPAFQFTMTMEAVDVPELGSGTIMTADGTFTDDGQRGSMTMDMSAMLDSLADQAGGADGPMGDMLAGLAEPWEIVVDGDTTYFSGGMFGPLLGADTEWVSVPTEGAGADPTGGFSDPSSFLDLLGQAGEVTEVGSEELAGTTTTHYQVQIDLAAMAASAAEQAGEDLPAVPGLAGTEATIDVWVDEDAQQVRRLQMELDGSALGAAGGGAMTGSMRMTIDITPLDEPVEVDVPDPAEVTPMEELGGMFGGLGG